MSLHARQSLFCPNQFSSQQCARDWNVQVSSRQRFWAKRVHFSGIRATIGGHRSKLNLRIKFHISNLLNLWGNKDQRTQKSWLTMILPKWIDLSSKSTWWKKMLKIQTQWMVCNLFSILKAGKIPKYCHWCSKCCTLRSNFITKFQRHERSRTLVCTPGIAAAWHVIWHNRTFLKKVQISAVLFLLSANNVEEATIIHFEEYIWDTRAVYWTNWFVAHSFNALAKEIYKLNGFYSRKITR